MSSDKPEEFDKFLSQELRDTVAKCNECKEKSTEEVDEKKSLKRARESSAESDTEQEAKDSEGAKERKRELMPRTEMHMKVLQRIAGKKRATELPSDPIPASEDSSEEDEEISGSKSETGEESEEEIWIPRRAARFN